MLPRTYCTPAALHHLPPLPPYFFYLLPPPPPPPDWFGATTTPLYLQRLIHHYHLRTLFYFHTTRTHAAAPLYTLPCAFACTTTQKYIKATISNIISSSSLHLFQNLQFSSDTRIDSRHQKNNNQAFSHSNSFRHINMISRTFSFNKNKQFSNTARGSCLSQDRLLSLSTPSPSLPSLSLNFSYLPCIHSFLCLPLPCLPVHYKTHMLCSDTPVLPYACLCLLLLLHTWQHTLPVLFLFLRQGQT